MFSSDDAYKSSKTGLGFNQSFNQADEGASMDEQIYSPILHNFNAGPGALPKAVMNRLQSNLLNYKGLGISVIEMSHR